MTEAYRAGLKRETRKIMEPTVSQSIYYVLSQGCRTVKQVAVESALSTALVRGSLESMMRNGLAVRYDEARAAWVSSGKLTDATAVNLTDKGIAILGAECGA
jgi:predicted transcriptional regulator